MSTKSEIANEILETMKEKILENNRNKYFPNRIPISVNITHDLVNELFHENNCTLLKTPKQIYENSLITFYRNENPERIMVAHLNSFVANPQGQFQKSGSKIFKPHLSKEESQKLDEKLKANKSEKLYGSGSGYANYKDQYKKQQIERKSEVHHYDIKTKDALSSDDNDNDDEDEA
ncbi:hypothetical protein M9Y10_017144 [Tritrichomonas musculus]|uniref:Uncharacterized protein n=1 Tax=Tritrichomonas musculus TaxID=1915356 RepID=A0ABR2HW23_9EUKA